MSLKGEPVEAMSPEVTAKLLAPSFLFSGILESP
jgi:hypothetical protein